VAKNVLCPTMMPEGSAAPFSHAPVLLDEILEFLFSDGARTGGTFCDATLGGGGHSRAILERASPETRLVGMDRDPQALSAAKENLEGFGDRITLVHAPFSRIGAVLQDLAILSVDGILADLGVSSPQLDRAERGFSFQKEGPLDMRMDQTQGETAAELLARLDERALTSLLRDFGEDRHAVRIVLAARDRGELVGTSALAAVVARAVPGHERHKNPATRTFQALRIVVNRELGELGAFLEQAPGLLAVGGRLCVITFHSLEDRIVKRRFRALAGVGGPRIEGPFTYALVVKRVVIAADAERDRNPRSRSAKLRVLERVA
jgi:16S rRNA (cytosine1402-N4)-methyltransferase